MNTRASKMILVVLILLSAGQNVLLFNALASREDQWDESFILESLFRLGLSRTILVDPDNSLSVQSLERLHGQLLMDQTRVQPVIGELGVAYQQRYEQILTDLNEFRISNPELISRKNTIMDDGMYSRYIDWITNGYNPE